MPHHGSSIPPGATFGPTGNFPDGKLGEHDEGEIVYGVSDKDGVVIINFGKPVSWLGLRPSDAHELAGALVERAKHAETA